jgi:hypothetical protein
MGAINFKDVMGITLIHDSRKLPCDVSVNVRLRVVKEGVESLLQRSPHPD